MANTLPARARVKKRRDIDQIYRKGKRVSGPLFRIHVRPNELGHARLAVGVPKRVGNAVRRNRWKRMLRESFRLNRARLAAVDVLIIPHGDPGKLKRQDVEKEVLKLLRKLRGVVP